MLPKMHGLVLPFLEEPTDEHSREKIAREWMERIAPYCTWVRSNYNFPAKPIHLADIVHAYGKKYVGGAWLSHDYQEKSNIEQIHMLVDETRKGRIDLGVIGSETILQGYLLPQQLIRYLRMAQEQFPSGEFTIAEDADDLLQYPELIDACKSVVGAHIYPFWKRVHVKHAVEYFAATYHALKKLAPDKKVVVLETGWPTSGGRQGDAVASYENALRYIEEISSWGRSMAVDVFIFEVMDELWKKEKTDTGMAGPHFGLWYHDGRPKHATSSQAAE